MADQDYDLIISVYDGRDTADRVFETVENMWSSGRLTLKDAAVVTRSDDGKIQLKNKGFVGTGEGSAIGLGVGLLLGGPLAGAAIGALIGFGRSGDRRKLRDTLNEQLGADQSAIALVLEGGAEWDHVRGAIGHYGGTVISSQLSDDAYEALKDLVEDDDVQAEKQATIEEVE